MTPAWLLWLEAATAASDEIVLAVARLSVLAAVVMLVIGAGLAPRVGGPYRSAGGGRRASVKTAAGQRPTVNRRRRG